MGVPPLDGLISELTRLPGIGQKSAQRLAFFMISQPEPLIFQLADSIRSTRQRIRYCTTCFNVTFDTHCQICTDSNRDPAQLCVVGYPKDIPAIERMGDFKGLYHVLGGLVSPLDGIHPEMLRIPELKARLETGKIATVILAINPTIEGDTTVLILQSVFRNFQIQVLQLAYGLPVGSDMEYADELTLKTAFANRAEIR